jgi:hypothetical protein
MTVFSSTSQRLLLLLGICGVLAVWWLHDGEEQDQTIEHAVGNADRHEEPGPQSERQPHTGVLPVAGDLGGGVEPALPSRPSSVDVIVTGHVVSLEDQKPVPRVDVIFSKEGLEWTATSDDSGEYSLALVAGTYQVRAFGDRVMAIHLPKLVLGGTARTYDVSVVEHSVVRGEVRYQDGSAAVGAIVMPQSDDKSASKLTARGEVGSAEVQDDGSFELFTLQGNLILHASGDAASGMALVPALKAGEEREQVRIVLVPNGFVAGVVLGPKGVPIEGARVLASVQIPGTGEYDRVPMTTDDEGRFKWQVLRPAHTIVEAAADGFARSTPQAFTLDPGSHREDIELTLHEATQGLVGHVHDASGEPLSFVEVAQGQEGSKARYKKAYTDADGRFEITALGPGPHRLRARKTGYKQTRLRQIVAPATNLSIVMSLNGSAESHL